MTAPAPSPPDPELERQVAARTAELTEMLAWLANCWDQERRQLARQLHDSLGSSMTALTMHLALLTQNLPADSKARDRAAQMKTLLAGIIETHRKMQLELWNDKLEFLGLRAALEDGSLETPKPGDPRFAGHEVHLIATPQQSLDAAAEAAVAAGIAAHVLSDEIEGESPKDADN